MSVVKFGLLKYLPLLLCEIFLISTWCLAQQKMGNGNCRLQYRLVNRNRHIEGHKLSAECTNSSFHSAPFGNWGVESNNDVKRNSRQFDGWFLADGLLQWNSCTSDTVNYPTGCSAPPGGWPDPGFPHFNQGPYYNFADCQQQFSNTGVPNWGIHAGVAPNELFFDCVVSCANGCLETDGFPLQVQNHFMKLFELDSPGTDVQTGSLSFGTQVAIAECFSDLSCVNTISMWVMADDISTGVDAEAAVEIVKGEFIDQWGQCSGS